MNKKLLGIILIIMLVLIIIYLITSFHKVNDLPTYFHYSAQEINTLNELDSTEEMSKNSLNNWDTMMFDLIKKNKLGDAPASRVYAYIYTSQRDATFLSYQSKHRFAGNLDAISAGTLCLFFPNDCRKINFQVKTDAYSNQLAKLVLNKIKQRMLVDEKQRKVALAPVGSKYWAGIPPYFGQDVGSWQTWLLHSKTLFIAPKPFDPMSSEWLKQLKITEIALKNITPEQKKAVVFWAGNPSTKTPPGIWLEFANDTLLSEQIPLEKMVLIRSVLAMALADAIIIVFQSKYTYWIKRPFMQDSSLLTVMPTPNHPSYPAGHATVSATAAVILTYYFPAQRQIWQHKAYEAEMTRIWGGIHFPIDVEEGEKLGKKVGNAILSQPSLAK